MPAIVHSGTGSSVIDKMNWQEAEGLLPQQAVEWVKKGDLVLNVDTLGFNPKEYVLPWIRESYTENVGVYELDNEFDIVEAKTGKKAVFIKGIPFPEISQEDPKAGAKIMYNAKSFRLQIGRFIVDDVLIRSIDRKAGQERYIACYASSMSFTGYPGAKSLANPHNFEELVQVIVRHPYDMAGTALMDWQYIGVKPNMSYGYVPAIRRVRRMSPSDRCTSLFGTDFVRDDWSFATYDGEIADVDWKLIGREEVLGAWASKDLIRWVKTDMGWKPDPGERKLTKYGFETDGWTGAPWINTAQTWVRRPVWVVEGQPKDPYYNYGKFVIYVDADVFAGVWKLIWDRSGEYWKTVSMSYVGAASEDGQYRGIAIPLELIVDERAQHASVTDYVSSHFIWYQEAPSVREEQFTLTGFQALCK
ncbi:MAG: DUF1329 domain-containing protein [Acidobacteriota bacterium]